MSRHWWVMANTGVVAETVSFGKLTSVWNWALCHTLVSPLVYMEWMPLTGITFRWTVPLLTASWGIHQFILFPGASLCPQHCAEMGLNAQGLPRVVDTFIESNGSLLHSGSMCTVQGSSRPSRGPFRLYPVWVVALRASASSLCPHSIASLVRQEKCLPCPLAESLGR